MEISSSLWLILILFLTSGHAFGAEENAQSFTLDGRLYLDHANGVPLVDTGTFKIQILDPTQTCVLYEEQQAFDTTLSAGAFNIHVGEKTSPTVKRTLGDQGHTLANVFANKGGTIAGKAVADGSFCTGSVGAGARRYIRIVVMADSNPTPKIMEPFTLDSVPSALVAERAESLGGIAASGFARINTVAPAALSQANLENIFSTTNYTKLTDLLGGTSAQYVLRGTNGAIQAPPISGTPATPVAGQVWYDSGVIKYWDGSAAQTLSAGSGITSLTIGTGLTPAGTITSGGSTIAVDVGTTAGKVVQVQAGGKLPALDGSDLTGVVASALSGTASISTAGTISSGAITSTGALTGTETRSNSVKIYKPSTSNYVEFVAPTSLAAPVTYTFPATAPGVAGYVLSSDTSGTLSWVAQTSAGLAAVSNTANLANGKVWLGDAGGKAQEQTMSGDATITNAGVLSLKNTGTAGTYKSVTTDAQGRVTAGTNPTTLSGFGITDAVSNAGGSVSIQSGLDASKGAAGTAGKIYFATDTSKIYRDNGTTWDTIASNAGTGITALTGDVTASGSGSVATTVAKIQGTTVSSTTPTVTGQILKYNSTGTQYAPGYIGIADIRSTVAGNAQFFPTNCGADQTITWQSGTDTMVCTNIAITAAQVSGLGGGGDFFKDGSVAMTGPLAMGGQTINGNSTSGGTLTLDSTSHVTKGNIILNPLSGNVGIGTTTVATPLHVYRGTDAELARFQANSDFASISIKNSSVSMGIGAAYGEAYIATGSAPLTIAAGGSNKFSATSAGIQLLDGVHIGGGTPPADGLLVGVGNVGIGTTSAARLLHVNGSMRLTATTTPSTPIAGDMFIDSAASNALKYYNGSGWVSLTGGGSDNLGNHTASTNIQLGSNWLSGDGGSEGVFVKGNGLVGIGTNDPLYYLDVTNSARIKGGGSSATLILENPAGTSSGIAFYSSGTYRWSIQRDGTSESGSDAGSDFLIQRYSDGASYLGPALKIQRSTGFVGIGTSTTNAQLTVEGAVSLDQMASDPAGSAGYGALYTKADGKLYYRNGTGTITDLTAGGADNLGNHTATTSLAMAGNTIHGNSTSFGTLTLDSTSHANKSHIILNPSGGNVGIGTSTPANRLTFDAAYGIADNSGSAANGGFRMFNVAQSTTLDMGVGINSTAWIQARNPSNYATKRDLLLNPVGGPVTIGGSNVGAGLFVNTTNSDNGVLAIAGNNASSTSSYGMLVLVNNATTPVAGNTAGEIKFSIPNHSTNSAREAAAITSKVEGSGGANGFGGILAFSVKADATAGSPVEAMRISSAGNVGIGTNNPARRLHVNGAMRLGAIGTAPSSPAAGDMFIDSTDSNALKYYNGSAWVSVISGGSGDFMKDGSVAMTGSLKMGGNTITGSAAASGNLTLDSTSDSTKGNILLATGGGSVGIGTNSPTRKFQLHDAGNLAIMSFTTTNSGAANTDGFQVYMNASNQASLWNNENAGMVFGTNNASRMVITNGGDVGIGTTGPARLLHVEGAMRLTATTTPGSPVAGDMFIDSTASNALKYYNGSGWVSLTGGGSDNLGNHTATTALAMAGNAINGNSTSGGNLTLESTSHATKGKVLIASGGGNVGIGTTTASNARVTISRGGTNAPTALGTASEYLHIGGTEQGVVNNLRMIGFGYFSPETYSPVYIGMQETSVTGSGKGDFVIGTRSVTTDTTPTERMRVDSNGNVGIGTNNPGQKLDVAGNIVATGRIVGGASTNSDALSAITADFTNTNMIRATGASAACGTLNFTNVAAGGSYTITILNASATCTTVQMAGSTTNVKMPSGYAGGGAASGVVYTAIHDGTTLWVSYVPF